jgi:preprotein translocase subunit SecD
MKKKLIFFIVFIIAAAMVYLAAFGAPGIKGGPEMRFGIDIRGGVEAMFQPVGIDKKPTLQQLESARSVIETRLDQKNIMDRDVTIDATNGYVIVRFPWKANETEFNPQ